MGNVSGSYDTITASGQKLTMANGSYINVGAGSLNIKVKNDITLADNSGATGGNPTYSLTKPELYATSQNSRYFNNGNTFYYHQLNSTDMYPSISLTSTNGSILGGSTSSSISDIITSGSVTLSANGSIGSLSNPIKIESSALVGTNKVAESQSYRPPYYMQTLYVTNTLGSSYINEINKQIFSTVNLTVGSSTTGDQSIKLINDSVTNKGHVNVSVTSGTMNIASNGINTEGAKVSNDTDTNSYNDFDYSATNTAIFPASVYITAPNIVLNDNSIKTTDISYHYGTYGVGSYNGMATYMPIINLLGTNSIVSDNSSKINNTYEITAPYISVKALNIGTSTNPLEIYQTIYNPSYGTGLYVSNSGGSTYLANANYANLIFEAYKTSGSHHILSSNGDFFNVISTGNDLLVETISGTSNGSNFGTSKGINTASNYNINDGTGVSRPATVSTRSGGIIFQDNSVNTGGQDFTATLVGDIGINDYSTRVIKAYNLYASLNPVAQIKAGNVYFNVGSQSFAGTIGASGYDIQIAKGNALSNTYKLQLDTYGGDVNIHELTNNYFSTIKTVLRGNNVSQNMKIDLLGADDVNISDNASLIILDKDKVNLSAGNRNWDFTASSRAIQVDDNSLSTGYYYLEAGKLYLNGDILTNGGQITLRANDSSKYIALMKSVRIDSNADDLSNSASTGYSGQIFIYSPFSGINSGYSLTVDTSSSNSNGGVMNMYGYATNTAGAYLSNLYLTTKGSSFNNDGQLYFYTNGLYSLNGDFTAIGNIYANYGLNVDTEQGNTNNSGNITLGGQDFYTGSSYITNLNAATTATGKNGGNINIYNTYYHSALTASQVIINTSGGIGGTFGNIILPSINTITGNANGTQTYTGGTIVLNGNLLSNFGNITLNGDVQIANDILIDTWNNTASTKAPTQNGNVIINGGLSATVANKTLTIDTSNDTGTDDFVTTDGTTHNLADYYTHNAGSININGSNTSGSSLLGGLNITAIKNGSYNNGINGSITLSGITTSGSQSYIGNTTNITGSLTGDTIVFDTKTQDTTVTSTGVITTNNLLLKGNSTDYSFLATSGNKIAKLAANGVKSLSLLNDNINLAIDSIQSILGITATGIINIATKSSDITISNNIQTQDTTANAITLNAGKSASAGTSTGGDIKYTFGSISTGTNGIATLYSGSISGSSISSLISTGNFRYNTDESSNGYNTTTAALSSGLNLLYRERPILSVTPSTATSVYGNTISVSGVTPTISGYVNSDSSSTTSGTAIFTTTATNTSNVEAYNIAYSSGLLNSLGYGFADVTGSTGEYTITQRAITLTADAVSKIYGENNPNLTYQKEAQNGTRGLVNNDTFSGSLATSATQFSNVGIYGITSTLANSNYAITYVGDNLTIGQRAITLTADAVSKIYGENNPNLTYQKEAQNGTRGLVNSDTFSGVLSTDATVNSTIGNYDILSSLSNTNYNINYVPSQLNIAIKPTTAQVSLKTSEVTGIPLKLDGILSSELISQGAKIVVLDATNKDVTELAKEGKIQPGKYSVKAINENPNYALSSNEIELTINPALDPITVVKTQVPIPVIPSTIKSLTTDQLKTISTPTSQKVEINNNLALKLGVDSGSVNLVSQTVVGQPNQVVTLSELKTSSQENSNTTEKKEVKLDEVKVSLNQNSIVQLVNGGVLLPTGVDQQFYVVKQDMNAINQSNSSNLNNESKDNKSKGTN